MRNARPIGNLNPAYLAERTTIIGSPFNESSAKLQPPLYRQQQS